MKPSRRFSPAQVRAARGLLGWSAQKLANRAALPLEVVERCEAGAELPDETRQRISDALCRAGLKAIPENGAGEGVRFRHSAAARLLEAELGRKP